MRQATTEETFELELKFGHAWQGGDWLPGEVTSRKFLVLHHEKGQSYSFGNAFVFLQTSHSVIDKCHYYCCEGSKSWSIEGLFWQVTSHRVNDIENGTLKEYPQMSPNGRSIVWTKFDA